MQETDILLDVSSNYYVLLSIMNKTIPQILKCK